LDELIGKANPVPDKSREQAPDGSAYAALQPDDGEPVNQAITINPLSLEMTMGPPPPFAAIRTRTRRRDFVLRQQIYVCPRV